jgi:hypothetical protein
MLQLAHLDNSRDAREAAGCAEETVPTYRGTYVVRCFAAFSAFVVFVD